MTTIARDDNSFISLLAQVEQAGTDRSGAIALYRTWIERNTAASPALYGGYFNLAVELSAGGDKDAAVEAYRIALAIRPGFFPAAINLGTLMENLAQPDAALAVWWQGLQTRELRTSVLEFRERLTAARRTAEDHAATVVRIGSGPLPPMFQRAEWREVRLDATMSDLNDASVDAVCAAETFQHLHAHEVEPALRDMRRVLKPAGFAFVQVPDLREVARHVADGRLEEPLYISPAGPISPLDILYGHRRALARDPTFSGPRTGFTDTTLARAMIGAGFATVMIRRDTHAFQMTAIGFRDDPDERRLAMLDAQMLSDTEQRAVLYRAAA